MSYFFQLVVSGIVVGSIYALSALGFVLIYKSSRVLNIAHGQIIAAGAFVTYALTVWLGIPIYISFLMSLIITFFLAMSVERIFLRRLIGEPIISVIMVTIGLMSILDGIIYLTPFGAENFSFPEFLPKTPIALGGVSISWTQLVGVIITAILIAGFTWFFKRSTLGISMRAVSDDQMASMSIGISIPKVFGLAWATAGFSAAAAGGIIGNITGLNFDTLHTFGIIVFPVVILGGLDSIFGAVVAGIIMGLIQQFAAGYLDGH
jgi:branched-chain amino acid transport system permease protein